jgi:UDP-N-acetylmuramyl pentapeptide synthase
MNIYELNNIIEGKITNIHKKIYKNIQTDTRKIDNESLLFVFNLKHDNAYKYVRNMKIRPAIIVINDYEENIENISCIKVKNTIKAYSMLASYYKNKKYIPTIIPAAIKRIHKMEIHKLT